MTVVMTDVIAEAFRRGFELHIFCERFGPRILRVVRWQLDGELVGYGQGPTLCVAWQRAIDDLAENSRPYEDVYGNQFPAHYAGDERASGSLERWVVGGNMLYAYQERDLIEVQLRGWREDIPDPSCVELARRTGVPQDFMSRGVRYSLSLCSNSVVMQVVSSGAHRAFNYRTLQTASAADLITAQRAAFKVPPLEVLGRRSSRIRAPRKAKKGRGGRVEASMRPTADASA